MGRVISDWNMCSLPLPRHTGSAAQGPLHSRVSIPLWTTSSHSRHGYVKNAFMRMSELCEGLQRHMYGQHIMIIVAGKRLPFAAASCRCLACARLCKRHEARYYIASSMNTYVACMYMHILYVVQFAHMCMYSMYLTVISTWLIYSS